MMFQTSFYINLLFYKKWIKFSFSLCLDYGVLWAKILVYLWVLEYNMESY